MAEYDVCVIGGGLLGSAFGWGLVREGQRCVVLDEGDGAIRARVEALEVTLKDVTRPYRAPSGHVPDHGK